MYKIHKFIVIDNIYFELSANYIEFDVNKLHDRKLTAKSIRKFKGQRYGQYIIICHFN